MSIDYFDAIYCICMKSQPHKQKWLLDQLNLFYPNIKPYIFEAINTRYHKNKWGLDNHHVGCCLSHRSVIQLAKDSKYKRILIFEEDAVFHKNFKYHLDQNIEELKRIPWDMVYLGACIWNDKYPKVDGCRYLEKIYGATCTTAYGINHTLYDTVLTQLSTTVEGTVKFCREECSAIDQWYAYQIQSKTAAYITSPRLCSQPFLVGTDKQDSPRDFIPHGMERRRG